MTRKTVVYLRTSHKPEQALGAPLVQSQMGGEILRVARQVHADSPPGTRTYRADSIESAHIAATSASRAVLDVARESWPAFLRLLKDCPGTAADYQMCVLSTTPDDDSQRTTFQMANAMVDAGMDPTQIRFIRVAERYQAGDVAYPLVAKFCDQHGLDHGHAAAILRDTDVLLQAQRDGVSLGELLHGKTDFQARLDEVRHAEPDEGHFGALMHKVLRQRKFIAIRERVAQVIDPLDLPRITSAQWMEEADRFAAAARCRFPHVCAGGETFADVSPTAPEAAQEAV
ncbi:hypothetical protein P3T40_007677 [Paraburkholderia sp. EB58]|jgi:hypothetical protein|uniref:hypothetical protein n=1 Tax=Paraburkholderia sp. EB58 TaxID=3035125 RepID=UPI003D1D91B4